MPKAFVRNVVGNAVRYVPTAAGLWAVNKYGSGGGSGKKPGHSRSFRHRRPRTKFVKKSIKKKVKKRKLIKESDLVAGLEENYYKVVGNKYPKKLKLSKGSTWRYVEINQAVISWTGGQQAVQTIGIANSVAQQIVGGVPTPSYQDSAVALFALNPSQASTGSAWLNAVAQPSNDKIFLKRLDFSVDVSNLSTLSCVYDLYLCKAKRDIAANANAYTDPCTSIWGQGLKDDGLKYHVGAGQPAPNVALVSSAGSLQYNFMGLKPTRTKLFNQNFKVLKVHHDVLAAGATDTCKFSIAANVVNSITRIQGQNPAITEDPATWTKANVGTNYVRNGTFFLFLVIRGQPARNHTPAGASEMVYGPGEIGVIVKKEYVVKGVAAASQRMDILQGVNAMSVGATITNVKAINQNTVADNAGAQD